MSEPKVGGETGLLTIISLSHAEDMTRCATLCITNNDKTTVQAAVADDPSLAVVLPCVLDLDSDAFKHDCGILKVQAAVSKGSVPLGLIIGDAHVDSVSTRTGLRKSLIGRPCVGVQNGSCETQRSS
jgi:hypothetical protein